MNGVISWPIARATFQERTFRATTFAFAVLMALFGLSTGKEFGADAFSGVAEAWAFLLTLSISGGLLSDEIESGHAQLVLLRPITRAQWVGGRFAGAAMTVCAATFAGWVPSFVAGLVRGHAAESLGRLLIFPCGVLPQLAWLATLLALSAVLRSWANAGVLLAARIGWVMTAFFVPFRYPDLKPRIEVLDRYAGPQPVLALAREVQYGDKLHLSPIFWDLFWLFAAWAIACHLLNGRELARRRA